MKLCQVNRQGDFIKKDNLFHTLGLELNDQVVAFVGAGGKTTYLYHLAKEIVELKKKVIVTTTVHMYLPTEYSVLAEDKERVLHLLDTYGMAVVGIPSGEEKMTKVSDGFYEWMRTVSDYLLVEADGSKRLPIKVPANHEPVLPLSVDKVVILCGLRCLGGSIQEHCHRWELARKILNCKEAHELETKDIATLIVEGYCKLLTVPYKIILNQCDTMEVMEEGRKIVRYLQESKIVDENIILGSML